VTRVVVAAGAVVRLRAAEQEKSMSETAGPPLRPGPQCASAATESQSGLHHDGGATFTAPSFEEIYAAARAMELRPLDRTLSAIDRESLAKGGGEDPKPTPHHSLEGLWAW
jgi:hypothetical protein